MYTLALWSLSLLSSPLYFDPPTVVPYHANGIYELKETVGWNVSGQGGKYKYTVKLNNAVPISNGEIDLANGPVKIEAKPTEPAMLFMQLTPTEGGKPLDFGAAVSPTKIPPAKPKPKDFDAFWKSKIADLHKIPMNPTLTPGVSGREGIDYGTIRMDHVNGTYVYGQYARPNKPGKYPAILQLQWASPPYPLDKSWIMGYASMGFIALNIEPHNVLPTEPKSYYDALPAALKNYGAINMDDRDKSYFVEMYLRDYRAVDYLASLPDWDGKTLVVIGTSMGGQQSLAVAGLHPKITHLIVNVPAGCDLNAGLHNRQNGYPFFPSNNPKVMETAQYVDCVNFASNIKATSLVAMGFVDTVSPPTGIWAAYNLIRGPKEAAAMFDSPHNHLATPEQQRPYTERSAAWLQALAKGEPAPVRK
ncbi:MAG: hypothetical protein BGO01_19785 [Armatimonadetes bacterium 55-13]|nr:acetylxylan esterase [Armatimonadota bacterium]OJU64354.1 MAG: hypothetical protein BGO01_19785 [Armatimonadetes bacterium 55-13]